jgi:hypothetical protein
MAKYSQVRNSSLLAYGLAPAIGIVSFLCSRGPDGKPFVALWAFSAIAIAYITILVMGDRRTNLKQFIVHVFLFESATIAPFFIPPPLEEMAGMLYVIMIACTAGVSLLGVIATLGRWAIEVEPHACSLCAYSLVGNQSGACPECGKAVHVSHSGPRSRRFAALVLVLLCAAAATVGFLSWVTG